MRVAAALCLGLVAIAAGACKPEGHVDPWLRAGDAGFVYRAAPSGRAGAFAPLSTLDGGLRPAITLVAGSPGGRGDLDGVGADARLGLVGGMARVGDAIVFADEGNGTIRRFTPATQAVETLLRLPSVEGGRPSLPAFVAYDDKTRRLFVTERSRQVVYAIDLATKGLSILAGKPSIRGDADGSASEALFDAPTGLAFDGDHTLFVADVGNRKIRTIDVEHGTVATLARGYMQVWGLCFDGVALYASDNLSEALFRVDPKTGASVKVAGSNRFGYSGPTDGTLVKGRLREPRGLACTPNGVYVADRGNSAVRWIDRQGVSTLAGRSTGLIGFRDGYARDALFMDVQSVLEWDDTVYIGDEATIRSLSRRDATVQTVAGSPSQAAVERMGRGPIVRPSGVAWSLSQHAAYVANCGDSTVQRVDLDTHAASTFVGDPLIAGFVDGSGGDALFTCPSAIASDGRGNLFVGDRGNHALRSVVEATRRVVTMAGSPSRCGNDDGPFASATFCDPSALAFGDGALFLADESTATIRRIDLEARVVTTLAGTPFVRGHADGPGNTARFSSPTSIAYVAGALFVTDRDAHVIRRIDARTGEVTTLAGVAGEPGTADGALADARFERPRTVATSGADGLLVFDRRSARRVSLSGRTVTTLFVSGGGLRTGSVGPSLSLPAGAVEIGPGEALVVDHVENLLARVSY